MLNPLVLRDALEGLLWLWLRRSACPPWLFRVWNSWRGWKHAIPCKSSMTVLSWQMEVSHASAERVSGSPCFSHLKPPWSVPHLVTASMWGTVAHDMLGRAWIPTPCSEGVSCWRFIDGSELFIRNHPNWIRIFDCLAAKVAKNFWAAAQLPWLGCFFHNSEITLDCHTHYCWFCPIVGFTPPLSVGTKWYWDQLRPPISTVTTCYRVILSCAACAVFGRHGHDAGRASSAMRIGYLDRF